MGIVDKIIMSTSRSSNIDSILLKDKINTICQINKLQFPIHSYYFSFNQKISTLSIGKILFVGHNSFVDDRVRTTKFLSKVIDFLSDKDNMNKYILDLSSTSFDCVQQCTDQDDILNVFKYSDLVKMSI